MSFRNQTMYVKCRFNFETPSKTLQSIQIVKKFGYITIICTNNFGDMSLIFFYLSLFFQWIFFRKISVKTRGKIQHVCPVYVRMQTHDSSSSIPRLTRWKQKGNLYHSNFKNHQKSLIATGDETLCLQLYLVHSL